MDLIILELNPVTTNLVLEKLGIPKNILPLVNPDLIRDPDTNSGWKQDLNQFQWTQRDGSFGRVL